MTEKLKPCPVCGSSGEDLSIEFDWGCNFLTVYCHKCKISGPSLMSSGFAGMERQQATETWNALPRRDEK